MVELGSLHPGGLALTRALTGSCHLGRGARVPDVACGTGETACLLAGEFAGRAPRIREGRCRA